MDAWMEAGRGGRKQFQCASCPRLAASGFGITGFRMLPASCIPNAFGVYPTCIPVPDIEARSERARGGSGMDRRFVRRHCMAHLVLRSDPQPSLRVRATSVCGEGKGAGADLQVNACPPVPWSWRRAAVVCSPRGHVPRAHRAALRPRAAVLLVDIHHSLQRGVAPCPARASSGSGPVPSPAGSPCLQNARSTVAALDYHAFM